MSYFFALPSKARGLLADYFSNKPVGSKIKFGSILQEKVSGKSTLYKYALENSYIKLKNDIYALGRKATVGKGTFGTVKFVQSFSMKATYMAKIQQYQPSKDDSQLYNIERNISASRLGFIQRCGSKNYQN